jgi:hypothetical protein
MKKLDIYTIFRFRPLVTNLKNVLLWLTISIQKYQIILLDFDQGSYNLSRN